MIALFVLSIIIFGLVRISGNPVHVMLPAEATEEDIVHLTAALGLDKPYPVQYWLFISKAVQGDFGDSFRFRQPVNRIILERLPKSMSLAAVSIAFTLLMAFPLGVIAAVRRGTWVDTIAKGIAVLGQSLPSFWLGIVLIEIFAVYLGVLPSFGIGGFDHYILPAFTLGWFVAAGIMRLLRSSMLEVLDSEFVKMARIKGLSERKVIWKHALRNALTAVVTFSGMYFAILITAAIVVETVFAWPGIGRLVYEGIVYRDFPVVQGVVLTAAAIIVVVNLVVDMLYAYIDPRIRYG